jgi:hypothetical protein
LEDFQDNDTYKLCNPDNKQRPGMNNIESAFDLKHCNTISEEQITVNITSDSFKITVKWEDTNEQVCHKHF